MIAFVPQGWRVVDGHQQCGPYFTRVSTLPSKPPGTRTAAILHQDCITLQGGMKSFKKMQNMHHSVWTVYAHREETAKQLLYAYIWLNGPITE